MEYFDNKHRIMRYLAKVKSTGKISTAHLKGMKPVGNDYAALLDIKRRGGADSGIPEVIPYTDGEFDMDKVKQVFASKGLISENDFDIARQELESEGYIKSDKFEAEDKAVNEHNTMESVRIADKEARELVDEQEKEAILNNLNK